MLVVPEWAQARIRTRPCSRRPRGLWVTYGLLAAGSLGGQTGAYHMVHEAGGYARIVCGVAAWSRAFAGVTNATFRATVVPVGLLGTRTLGPLRPRRARPGAGPVADQAWVAP